MLCRWGYMLVADPGAALQETRRVLRPGGRVALATWAAPEANPWVSRSPPACVRRSARPSPTATRPGCSRLAEPERVRSLLEGAGFSEVRADTLDFEQSWDSPQGWWGAMLDLGRPMAMLLEAMDADARERVRAEVLDAVGRSFATPAGGLAFPARAVLASATA